jgi:hypothetical protein
VEDVLSGERIAAGSTLALGAWDVRVLVERASAKEERLR